MCFIFLFLIERDFIREAYRQRYKDQRFCAVYIQSVVTVAGTHYEYFKFQ